MIELIKEIDGGKIDPMDISDILHESKCITCGRKYNGCAMINFVRVSNGTLLWWHRVKCVQACKK